ncbi:MFS transporter [Tatumella citrea]|uniref:MFS transporter n=1 Tax=Tatumella citrea TaxID=53336 RepID=A0A1Y0LFW8_TATCI|nr:MFS transporter [Tatumella citrea]ARU92934.1 MFS transporter [Tatumella citrea]ARU96973.1 MFS transporter [Tatumella citrea]
MAKRSNVRWIIFFLMLMLGAINYIDRASLSIALPYISDEFGLHDAQVIGFIQSGFFWAYALMQIPAGMLADRFKKRTIIALAAVFWGIAQAMVAVCTGVYSLFIARVALGVTESPIMPAGAKLMGTWLTPNERGRGSMLLDGGAPLGTAVGAIVITGLIAFFNDWRMAFVIAGAVTVAMGILVWWYIRNNPGEHPGVNKEELNYLTEANGPAEQKHQPPTFKEVKQCLAQRNVIALICGWCSYSTVFYGLMTWLPFYLQKDRDLNLKDMGMAMAFIFFLCFIGQMLGGYLMDKLRKRGYKDNTVFHSFLSVSAIAAGVGVYLAAQATSPIAVIMWLGVAIFGLRWCSVYWSIPSLLGAQKMAGSIVGIMNFSSNIWSAIVPIVIGYLVSFTGNYYSSMMLFVAAALVYLISSLMINFDRPITVGERHVQPAKQPLTQR